MRILCIDDDQEKDSLEENKKSYCDVYGLDPSLVRFADTLNTACTIINEYLNEIDLVILDIKIQIGNGDSYKKFLKDIVTPEMLDKNNDNYSGFYLYLLLLHLGFPNERICFLSGNIERQSIKSNTNININALLELKDAINNKRAHIDDLLKKLENSMNLRVYNRLKMLVATNAYSDAARIIDDIVSENTQPKELVPNQSAKGDIYDEFDAFKKAGLYIPDGCKFYKDENKRIYLQTDDKSHLQKWIDNKDPNNYYALHHAIIRGCKEIYKKIDDIESSEDLDFNTKKYELNQLIIFDKFGDYNQKQATEITIKDHNGSEKKVSIYSNKDTDKYDSSYFKDMLISLQNLLPVREPSDINKMQLYKHIVKIISHPWEAAKPSYSVNFVDRKELFYNAASCIMNSVRNWVAHSRLKKFLPEDTAFIFLMATRTYFSSELSKIYKYEHILIGILSKLNGPYEIQNSEDITRALTKSLKTLNETNQYRLIDINISNLYSSIGRKKDCDNSYIYGIFWHVMYYPTLQFENTNIGPFDKPGFRFNTYYNKNNGTDIIDKIYDSTFNLAFKNNAGKNGK